MGLGERKTSKALTVDAGFEKSLQFIENNCNGKLEQHM